MKVFDLKGKAKGKGKGEGKDSKLINKLVDTIDIEDIGQLESVISDYESVEVVPSRLRSCTYCRECIRLPKREKIVELLKDKTHFTF